MTILGDIIQDLATDKLVEQVHMICQRIKEEEQVSFEYIEYASEGPNIFLTLEVPGRNKKEVGFLSLEREGEEIYLSIYSTLSLFMWTIPPFSLKKCAHTLSPFQVPLTFL